MWLLVIHSSWGSLWDLITKSPMDAKRQAIYQGPLKAACVPGLTCYSCPMAAVTCPMGTIQAMLATPGLFQNMVAGNWIQAVGFFYAFGFIGIIGTLVGRMACGWACPIGFLQDLMYKIRLPKLAMPDVLGNLKFVVLFMLVFILPLAAHDAATGVGHSWFCKLICIGGTLGASIPHVVIDWGWYKVGWNFILKVGILVTFLALFLLIKRPFCRMMCPLGALWSVFNRFSFYKLAVDQNRCIKCNACQKKCPCDVKPYETPNSEECVRCLDCLKVCPVGALASQSSVKAMVMSESWLARQMKKQQAAGLAAVALPAREFVTRGKDEKTPFKTIATWGFIAAFMVFMVGNYFHTKATWTPPEPPRPPIITENDGRTSRPDWPVGKLRQTTAAEFEKGLLGLNGSVVIVNVWSAG
jgi:ferredoxin-type protein NapH